MVCLDSFKLQTMTAFNQKFLRGGPDATRGQFFQKAPPLAAGGKKKFFVDNFVLFCYSNSHLNERGGKND
jgi:hypothetical protein